MVDKLPKTYWSRITHHVDENKITWAVGWDGLVYAEGGGPYAPHLLAEARLIVATIERDVRANYLG